MRAAWSDGGAQIHEFTAGETSQTFIATFTSTAGSEFNRGDTNGDQDLNIADAILALDYLFGTTAVDCLDAVDANDDGTLDVADVITLLGYLFQAGSPLPPPFGVVPEDCGADPTDDALDCVMPNCG